MNKVRIVLFGIIIVTVGIYIGIANMSSSKKAEKYDGPVDKITIGKQAEYGTLIVVAKEQGYFSQNGLDVTIKEFDTGASAFKDLLHGSIDMADAAEFVGVRNSFSGEDFKLIGAIGTVSDVWEVVARRDHGISKISDLRGKKIGVTRKTNGEFFLGNFLILNQILPKDIQIVNLPPLAMTKALQDGTIDALLIFEPHVFTVKERLGSKAISWSGQNGRANYIGLFAAGSLVRSRPDVAKRVIQSLVQAQEYLENNDGALEAFMKNDLHYSDLYIQSVLPKFKFYVSLEQPMILLMEDEARWAIDTKLTTSTRAPNYLNFIHLDALNAVNPKAITIIR